jgi:hypothetical protein
MNNKKITKDILERIKKEDIKQTPKYAFILKDVFVWFFLVSSIILLSISLAISFDYLISADTILFKKI